MHAESNLDQYLSSIHNIEIYKKLLTNSRWKNIIEPLDLFNLVYKKMQICLAYCDSPGRIIKHLKLINLTDEQFHCFYHFLIEEE